MTVKHSSPRGQRRPRIKKTPPLAVRGLPPRRVTVYLPPHYEAVRPAPYPLLLALDGQTMPQWQLAKTLDELVAGGRIEPVVVAAVPASAARMDEHGTAGILDFAG